MDGVSLKDVSRQAGVSISTISHILNGRRDRYSSETCEMVMEVAQRLGYRSNHLARSLRHQRSFSIGLAVPEFFFRLDRIERMASESGYRVQMAAHHGDASQNEEVISDLLARQVDGLLLIYPEINDARAMKLIAKKPVVSVDVIERSFGFSLVNDITRAAYIATEHLIGLGHRNIAYLGPSAEASLGRQRIRGYSNALRDHGHSFNEDSVLALRDDELPHIASEQAMDSYIAGWDQANRPTALVASNCEVAAGACASLARAGIQVPKDFSVIATMDQILGKYAAIPITSVDDHHHQIIEDGMKMLLNQLSDAQAEAVSPVYTPTVIERNSCCRCA